MGDYKENGLLMCGKCHTAKEKIMDLPKPDGSGSYSQTVGIQCRCQKEAMEQAAIESKKMQFAFNMDELRDKYGLSDGFYKNCTFEMDDRQDAELSDICRRYVARWKSMEDKNLGILFYGPVGTGKSYYACAIANALLDKCVSALVTNFPRLLNILQGVRDRQSYIDALRSYRLLVIDDLGVERDSQYAAEQVFNVIDARSRSGLPLIVTTNLSMDELDNPPTTQHARIYDRVKELCPIRLKMTGQSRRGGNAAIRRALALELLKGGEEHGG